MAEELDPALCWWVPAVTAPCRDWPGHPGCRKGARYLVSAATYRAAHQDYPVFSSRADCLQWIMKLGVILHPPGGQRQHLAGEDDELLVVETTIALDVADQNIGVHYIHREHPHVTYESALWAQQQQLR